MERRVNSLRREGLEPEPQVHTEAEDLQVVRDFFGVKSDGEQMQKLTALDPDTLRGVFDGSIQESGRRDHSAVLGRFARTSQELLEDLTLEPINNEGMLRWLESGQVKTSQGMKRPIEALADSLLAREALVEVSAADYGGAS